MIDICVSMDVEYDLRALADEALGLGGLSGADQLPPGSSSTHLT